MRYLLPPMHSQVRYLLSSMGRLEDVTQVIINPSDEAYFNVVSSMSKKEDVRVRDVGWCYQMLIKKCYNTSFS